ncbi:MAG: 50S ribosomal protein L25 [Treponemataceae bacterium]|nr:50S ribosomal protein L25 [Treponemataceae bacterium]
MEQLVLKASKRTETGKAAAKKIRESGRLPAVVYNHKGEATMLTVDEAEFTKVWKQATATTLICLDVDGEKLTAFIKDTEYDIISNKNLHVDFHAVDKDQKLRNKIKIQTTGTPVGVREGGFMLVSGASVVIECLPKDLPARIVADIDSLKIGESFCIKDLQLDKGIKVLSDPETVVVSVKAGK